MSQAVHFRPPSTKDQVIPYQYNQLHLLNSSMSSTLPTTSSTSAPLFSTDVDVGIGVILITCFTLGTLGNILALGYFTSRKRTTSNILYLSIVSVDLVSVFLMFWPGLSHFLHRAPLVLSYPVICNMWGVLFFISARLSVFLVAVLSISRTVSLLSPFSPARKRYTITPILIYTTLLLLIASLPYWHHDTYTYSRALVFCGWDIPPHHYLLIFTSVFILLNLLPFLPIMISCVLAVQELTKPSLSGGYVDRGRGEERRFTSTTIVIITAVYLVLNLPVVVYSVMFIVGLVDIFSNYLTVFVFVYNVGFNAAVNPVVYLCRFRGFRRYVGMLRSGGSLRRRRRRRRAVTLDSPV